MRLVAELRAVEVSSSHQFEEEVGAASSENGLFIAKMEFSLWTRIAKGSHFAIHKTSTFLESYEMATGHPMENDNRRGERTHYR